MRRFLMIALLAVLPVSVAFAQPLAGQVPDDAIAYVGWAGTSTAGNAYEQSHLKAIVDASNIRELFTEFIPAAIAKMNERKGAEADAPDAAAMRLVTSLLNRVTRQPCAFVFHGMDMTNPRQPLPRLTFLVDAGAADEADQFLMELNAALAQLPRGGAPAKATKAGTIVALSTTNYAAPQKALAANPKFTAAIGQVQKDGVFAMYADVKAVLKLIDDTVAADKNPQAKTNWTKLRDALNLRGIKRIATSAGFDGKDWGYRAFVDAPAPRTGIASFFEGAPVSDDALKMIPATAVMASAGHFDLAVLIDMIRGNAQKVDPKVAGQVGMVFGMADGLLGMNLRNDLLEPMGSEWVSYVAPDVGGAGVLGIALVNKLDDAAKVEAGLKQFVAGFNNAVRNQLAGKEITIEIREQKLADGTLMHYFATPFISPAWAVKHGNLHVGLYPQVCAAAVQHAPGKSKSILDNERFAALRKRLEAPNVSTIQYADLQATVPTGYSTWLLVSRYAGFGDIFGIKSPAMLIPPMNVLQQHLAPAGAVTWTDDAGWHFRGVSPFPGSETLATDPLTSMGAGQTAMMISILLPSLNRARETANRVKCASNQRQLGQAMLLYSNENKSKYPPRFGDLLRTQDITIEVFTCPSVGTAVPEAVKAGGMEAMATWIDEGNSDYIYLGAGKRNNAGAEEVMVYEKLHDHDGDGINILYGDGHVEFNQMESARELLTKQGVQLEE